MSLVRVPTPLRPYTDGQKEIEVQAPTVGEAMDQIAEQYPALKKHLYDDQGQIRSYVNLFLNNEDVRALDGVKTPLAESDRLTIVPSIAGGRAGVVGESEGQVDHNALRTNQAFIIALTLLAFVLDSSPLVAFVALVMLFGVALKRPGFVLAYRLLNGLGLVDRDVLPDHPEPHRFAQAVGGVFLAAATLSLSLGATAIGWGLSWVVVALASLNLFGGFCVGCAVYYWLSRLGLPGFAKEPPEGTRPGRRPTAGREGHEHA